MDDGAVAHYEGMLLSMQHRLRQNFTFHGQLHRLVLSVGLRFRRGAGQAERTRSRSIGMPTGVRASPIRATTSTLRWWRTSSWKSGNYGPASVAEQLAACAAVSRVQRPAAERHDGQDDSLTDLNNDRPDQVLADVYSATRAARSAPMRPVDQSRGVRPQSDRHLRRTSGRNALRGPGTVNVDVALSRIFGITERFQSAGARGSVQHHQSHQLRGGDFAGRLGFGFTTMNTNLSSHRLRTGAIGVRSAHFAVCVKSVFLSEI